MYQTNYYRKTNPRNCRLLGLGKPGYVFEEGPRRHQLKDPVLGRTLDITYVNNLKFVLFGWMPLYFPPRRPCQPSSMLI